MATLLLHVFGVLTRLIGCWVPFLYSTAMMSKDNLDSGLSDKETGVWKNNPKGISNSFKQEASTKRVRHPQAWSFRRHGWQKSFTLTRSDLGISRKELSEQFVALQKEIWDFGRVPVDERDERDERRSYYFCEGLFIVYLLFFLIPLINLWWIKAFKTVFFSDLQRCQDAASEVAKSHLDAAAETLRSMEERALCSWNIVLVKMFEHKSMGEEFSKNGETFGVNIHDVWQEASRSKVLRVLSRWQAGVVSWELSWVVICGRENIHEII